MGLNLFQFFQDFKRASFVHQLRFSWMLDFAHRWRCIQKGLLPTGYHVQLFNKKTLAILRYNIFTLNSFESISSACYNDDETLSYGALPCFIHLPRSVRTWPVSQWGHSFCTEQGLSGPVLCVFLLPDQSQSQLAHPCDYLANAMLLDTALALGCQGLWPLPGHWCSYWP